METRILKISIDVNSLHFNMTLYHSSLFGNPVPLVEPGLMSLWSLWPLLCDWRPHKKSHVSGMGHTGGEIFKPSSSLTFDLRGHELLS